MSQNGSAKKLLLVGALVGVLFLAVRAVKGGDEPEEEEEESIDRVDTGGDRNEDPVETGLDRVDTADEESDETDEADGSAESDDLEAADDEADDDETEVGTSMDAGVLKTSGGRLESLELLDYLAILGAAFDAAKREYDNRV